MKYLSYVISFAFTAFLLYHIYHQAGWATCVFAFLTYVQVWLITITLKFTTKANKSLAEMLENSVESWKV